MSDETPWVTRWYRRHWFGGTFLIILGLWALTLAFYVFGAEGISFDVGATQNATIDFNREYDHDVLDLGEGRGLELHEPPPGFPLTGSLIELKDGLPVICWVCGDKRMAGGLLTVEHRSGDWYFRKPDKDRKVDLSTLNAKTRDRFLTVAFNAKTGERVMVGENDSAEKQAEALASHGLDASSAPPLAPEALADLRLASMQREGCVVFNFAFIAVLLLWFVLGGTLALALKLRSHRRP